tara:strand:+ start:256 stop:651 length:396 start_codon:yes stop_codon:yes gene_type:complete
MGRKNTKKPGALVKMHRRRRPGLGIIVEVKDTDEIRQFARDKFKIRFKAIRKIQERVGYNKLYEFRREGIITEDQKTMLQAFFMYAREGKNRRMAKIRWINRPSAWETNTINESSDWYPFDMLRTVSAVKP